MISQPPINILLELSTNAPLVIY